MEGKSEWGDGRGREWQKINFTEEREEEGERNTAKDNQNPNECLVVESKMDQSWQGNNKTKKMIKASQETTIKAECVDREDREDREHQEAGRRIFLAARKKGVSLEGGINRHVFPNQSNLLAKLHAEKKIGRIGSR